MLHDSISYFLDVLELMRRAPPSFFLKWDFSVCYKAHKQVIYGFRFGKQETLDIN